MHTIVFLGLLKISAVLIALVLAATFAAYGSAIDGMHERALTLVYAETFMSTMLVIVLWLIARELRRTQEV
jgi:hypothetical protein